MFIDVFLGGYIRKFGSTNVSAKWNFINAIIGYFILISSFYLITYIGIRIDSQILLENVYFFQPLNSPIVIFVAYELFSGFIKITCPTSRLINILAGTTFGVYLLHENRIVNEWLKSIFPLHKIGSSILLGVYSIICIFIIYGMGSGVDFFRKTIFERKYKQWIEKKLNKYKCLRR